MHFCPLKNKTKLVPVKFGGLLGFGLLDTHRARASCGAPLGAPLVSARPPLPALPPQPPGAPLPSPTRGGRRGPGWPFPRVQARYLSGRGGGAARRGEGDSGTAPAAGPAPSRAGGGVPAPAAPPSGARVGREPPSGSGSLPGRDKVSATLPDASRRRGRNQPCPPSIRPSPPAPLLGSGDQGGGGPRRRLKGALPALSGERRSGSHLNLAGSGREGRGGAGREPQTHPTERLPGPRPRPGRG